MKVAIWSLVLAGIALYKSPFVIANPLVFKFNQNDMKDISDFLLKETNSYTENEEDNHKTGNNEGQHCGYEACNLGNPDMVNVHMVAHTHDDVGWLKTVDEYFYGARNDIQHAGVQYILDTVTRELEDDPMRRFIYVEIAFFERWWNEQSDAARHAVQRLVNQGRLEFILGGWCMNDEASTHYNAIIDQHSIGFKFIELNFGDCGRPKIGWQIDPFGHSREQASLFAQFGFDGLFFGRLDYQDKDTRLKSKTMEHMWMASANLGDQASLFTGVNYNGYGPPPGFCYDRGCADTPVMDDPRLEDYNVPDIVSRFLKAVKDQAQHYTTNHIMMTMGSDFQFENAYENFKNLGKLIKYVNMAQTKGSKVNLLYSTPSCYLYALNKANQTYTTKPDDFFPYASRDHTFWTGYFTSRPALKGYVRQCNNFLQVCKQMDTLAQLDIKYGSNLKLDVFRKAMGVAQHHDAVSGTEKQHVADDYAKRLARGASACGEVVNYAFQKLMPISSDQSLQQEFCTYLNVSKCPTTENSGMFIVTLYNPIARGYDSWVRVPVTGKYYSVTDPSNNAVKSELFSVSEQTKTVPAYNGSKATGELVFQATLQPLGFTTYFVQEQKLPMAADSSVPEKIPINGDVTIDNNKVSLTFDGSSGLLKGMANLESGIKLNVGQSLMYYESSAGNNSKGIFQASGAYIFRSNTSNTFPIATSVVTCIHQGKQVQEARQVFSPWASQVVRLYSGDPCAEFEWTIGPIPDKDKIGREVISRFTTDLDTQSIFYTDSNGREILERVRDYRPTWHFNQTEEVAGNYYPVNSRIYIQDVKENVQLSVLTDRSQGGGSIRDGEVELMIHRRMYYDDNFGVGEALNEPGLSGKGLVVRGKHYVCLDTIEKSGKIHRDRAEKLYMAPSLSVAKNSMAPGDYMKKYRTMWSGVKRSLPDNVHLLTLEQWHSNTYLLRLEHFYELTDDPVLSKPASVQLKGLFSGFNVVSVKEYTLGGNQPLSEAKRLRWNIQGHTTNGDMSSFVKPVDAETMTVVLNPMQIRTFRIIIK